MYELTPNVEMNANEEVIVSFSADRKTYWRDMAWMAAVAMAVGMVLLWAIGNPYVWTGAVGGIAAIGLRAWYTASDEFSVRWDLTNQRLLGPGSRASLLSNIQRVRAFGSAVQVITITGEKHLIKYQADKEAVAAAIEEARRKA